MVETILDVERIEDPRERAKAASRLLAESQSTLADLARLRREAIAELRAAGMTQAQVAEVLGVTPSRAAQLDQVPAERTAQVPVLVERAIPTDPSVRASSSLFLTEVGEQGVSPCRRMLHVGTVPAPAHIAARLGVVAGDPVVVRTKLMIVNDVPVRLSSSYFPLSVAEGTPLSNDTEFVGTGLQVLFDSMGQRFGRAIETFTARMPTPEEARVLELEPDVPVVVVLRSSYDADDHPIHTLETICASDRHVFPVRQAEGDAVF